MLLRELPQCDLVTGWPARAVPSWRRPETPSYRIGCLPVSSQSLRAERLRGKCIRSGSTPPKAADAGSVGHVGDAASVAVRRATPSGEGIRVLNRQTDASHESISWRISDILR